MNVKILARILLFALAFLAGVAYGQDVGMTKVVKVLNPVEIHIKPPNDGDILGKEFQQALLKELKKHRIFVIVNEESRKHCVIIFAVSPIHSNIGLKGYSVSYNTVTKHQENLNLDTFSFNASSLKEIAEVAVKETLKFFENEEKRQ